MDERDKAWEKWKDKVLFFLGIGGIIFEVVFTPMLSALFGVEFFHVEFLFAFMAVLGIPFARNLDRK